MRGCTREVFWHGKFETITVKNHTYSWSGSVPCTGRYRCMFCGKTLTDVEREEQLEESDENTIEHNR